MYPKNIVDIMYSEATNEVSFRVHYHPLDNIPQKNFCVVASDVQDIVLYGYTGKRHIISQGYSPDPDTAYGPRSSSATSEKSNYTYTYKDIVVKLVSFIFEDAIYTVAVRDIRLHTNFPLNRNVLVSTENSLSATNTMEWDMSSIATSNFQPKPIVPIRAFGKLYYPLVVKVDIGMALNMENMPIYNEGHSTYTHKRKTYTSHCYITGRVACLTISLTEDKEASEKSIASACSDVRRVRLYRIKDRYVTAYREARDTSIHKYPSFERYTQELYPFICIEHVHVKDDITIKLYGGYFGEYSKYHKVYDYGFVWGSKATVIKNYQAILTSKKEEVKVEEVVTEEVTIPTSFEYSANSIFANARVSKNKKR